MCVQYASHPFFDITIIQQHHYDEASEHCPFPPDKVGHYVAWDETGANPICIDANFDKCVAMAYMYNWLVLNGYSTKSKPIIDNRLQVHYARNHSHTSNTTYDVNDLWYAYEDGVCIGFDIRDKDCIVPVYDAIPVYNISNNIFTAQFAKVQSRLRIEEQYINA